MWSYYITIFSPTSANFELLVKISEDRTALLHTDDMAIGVFTTSFDADELKTLFDNNGLVFTMIRVSSPKDFKVSFGYSDIEENFMSCIKYAPVLADQFDNFVSGDTKVVTTSLKRFPSEGEIGAMTKTQKNELLNEMLSKLGTLTDEEKSLMQLLV